MNSTVPSPAQFLLDPLSDVTRKERRNLLIASTAGLLVAWAGFLPTAFTTFGITFDRPARSAFIALMAGTVFYFFVAFLLYGVADFFAWRKSLQDYLEEMEIAGESWTLEDQQVQDELRQRVPGIAWYYTWSKPVATARVGFEFVVPLGIGLTASIALLASI